MIVSNEHVRSVLGESLVRLIRRQTAIVGFQPLEDILKRQLVDVVIFEFPSINHRYILDPCGESRRPLKCVDQRGHSERGAEAYSLGYVEGLSPLRGLCEASDARTKLGELFSGLLRSATDASYNQH